MPDSPITPPYHYCSPLHLFAAQPAALTMQALASSTRLVRCGAFGLFRCTHACLLDIFLLKLMFPALQAAAAKVQTRPQRQAVVCSAVPQEQPQRRVVLAAGLAAGAYLCGWPAGAARAQRLLSGAALAGLQDCPFLSLGTPALL